MTLRDPVPHDEGARNYEDDPELVFGVLPPRKPLGGAARLAEVAEANRRIGKASAESLAETFAELQGLTPEEIARRKLPFALVPIAGVSHTDLAPPMYACESLIPIGHVTNLSGHGGAGKTILALMLAVSVALGLPLFGRKTRQGNVCFFSGEDGRALLLYRLKFICGAMGVNVEDLDGKLFILDATEGDATLFAELNIAGQRIGTTTSVYEALRAYCKQQNVSLLIVDNASEVYAASEIDRAKVRAFMRALGQIARECNAGVLLLAHVDKGTSKQERNGAEAYSGSTAWHNSARSRLFLRREADETLILEQQKNNLGPLHPPIRLEWPVNGIPQVAEPFGPYVEAGADRPHEKALLKLIAEYSARGEHITTATNSRNHAARVLRGEPGFPKRIKDAQLFDMLRKAERAGYLQRTELRGANRHRRECWQVTPAGAAFADSSSPDRSAS